MASKKQIKVGTKVNIKKSELDARSLKRGSSFAEKSKLGWTPGATTSYLVAALCERS